MTDTPRRPKPAPVVTPETQPFWDAAQREELQIQRCRACDRFYFYPRPFCPACFSQDVEWVRASGRATLVSYVINHRPVPGWEEDAPYAIALVELEEGPRMATTSSAFPTPPTTWSSTWPSRSASSSSRGSEGPQVQTSRRLT